MSTCLLVLGVPRSGTSCVAGILHHLGVPMYAPDYGDGGVTHPANPKGFFADTEFQAFCYEKYGTFFPTRPKALTVAERQELGRLIESRKKPLWGVKEWRIALFLDDFIELAGDVKIIRTVRPLTRSLESWNAHYTGDDPPTLTDYNRVNNYITTALQGKQYLTIDFDRIVDDKEAVLTALANRVGKARNAATDSFIDESLRRF